MPICLVHGDVLDAVADGLLLTIDGAKKGMEGSVARAYARRWPDAFEEIEYEIPSPLPLGRTVATHPESESPFPLVLIASTLNHIDVLTDLQKSGIVRSALHDAIVIAQRRGVRRLATPVMTGGWRLPFAAALDAMFAVAMSLTQVDSSFTLEIHIRDPHDMKSAVSHAKSMGVPIRCAS